MPAVAPTARETDGLVWCCSTQSRYQMAENILKTATRPFAPGVLVNAAFVERIEAIPTMFPVD